jgi:hypothetical protein
VAKVCGTCKLELPLTAFHANKTRKDGLATTCKACNKAFFAEYYAKNKKYHLDAVQRRKVQLYGPAKPKLSFEERFWTNVEKGIGDACWVWKGYINQTGYGVAYNAGKHILAHRYTWSLVNGEILPNMCICHKCDNTACVRPDHLFCGTQNDNQQDKIAKGREAHGESSGRAKLTEALVAEIRKSVEVGVRLAVLARAFGVDRSTIRDIAARKTWKDVL